MVPIAFCRNSAKGLHMRQADPVLEVVIAMPQPGIDFFSLSPVCSYLIEDALDHLFFIVWETGSVIGRASCYHARLLFISSFVQAQCIAG